MSWLARSLANSLIPDHRGDGADGTHENAARATAAEPKPPESDGRSGEEEEDDDDPSRGVKEDLSELSKSLARQFWGVASFLAPPPHSADGDGDGDGRLPDPAALSGADPTETPDSAAMAGIRSDFAEIGGRFRSSFSKLSGNMGVSEISKIASNFLLFGAEEEVEEDYDDDDDDDDEDGNSGGGAIGVTDEVMSFVRNISMHPETWLDFPLLSDDEDCDDFGMSDAQLEHALTVQSLSPRLAALRIELCPTHMSEGCFWKTYFVLLHPRLNKHDAELLSTPQIVEARALLLQKLQNQTKLDSQRSVDISYRKADEASFPPLNQVTISKVGYETLPSKSQQTAFFNTDKHPVEATDTEVIDKAVVLEEPSKAPLKEIDVVPNTSVESIDDDEDAWLKDETEDFAGSGGLTIPIDNEDVSFSDLEEEDETDASKAAKR